MSQSTESPSVLSGNNKLPPFAALGRVDVTDPWGFGVISDSPYDASIAYSPNPAKMASRHSVYFSPSLPQTPPPSSPSPALSGVSTVTASSSCHPAMTWSEESSASSATSNAWPTHDSPDNKRRSVSFQDNLVNLADGRSSPSARSWQERPFSELSVSQPPEMIPRRSSNVRARSNNNIPSLLGNARKRSPGSIAESMPSLSGGNLPPIPVDPKVLAKREKRMTKSPSLGDYSPSLVSRMSSDALSIVTTDGSSRTSKKKSTFGWLSRSSTSEDLSSTALGQERPQQAGRFRIQRPKLFTIASAPIFIPESPPPVPAIPPALSREPSSQQGTGAGTSTSIQPPIASPYASVSSPGTIPIASPHTSVISPGLESITASTDSSYRTTASSLSLPTHIRKGSPAVPVLRPISAVGSLHTRFNTPSMQSWSTRQTQTQEIQPIIEQETQAPPPLSEQALQPTQTVAEQLDQVYPTSPASPWDPSYTERKRRSFALKIDNPFPSPPPKAISSAETDTENIPSSPPSSPTPSAKKRHSYRPVIPSNANRPQPYIPPNSHLLSSFPSSFATLPSRSDVGSVLVEEEISTQATSPDLASVVASHQAEHDFVSSSAIPPLQSQSQSPIPQQQVTRPNIPMLDVSIPSMTQDHSDDNPTVSEMDHHRFTDVFSASAPPQSQDSTPREYRPRELTLHFPPL